MRIMLDAGHGYNTPGKRVPDGSMREWQFNSAVAEYAKDILVCYQGVDVVFAHDPSGKVDISLSKRTYHANQCGADVYVSIHANAFGNGWSSAEGIETYHHPQSSQVSKKLAAAMQKELISCTGLRNRGVKTANFQVLRETKMPAILLELGFMSNKEEAALLKSEAYRKKCGKAIADTLVQFYNLKAKPQEKPVKKGLYKVQVGAFSERKNADTLAAKLKKDGYQVYIVEE